MSDHGLLLVLNKRIQTMKRIQTIHSMRAEKEVVELKPAAKYFAKISIKGVMESKLCYRQHSQRELQP